MLGAFIAIAASIPQIIKLYKVKCSDEFQLSTWAVWMMTQVVSLAYVASIGNTLLVVTNILWVSFYALMVALIVAYRPKVSIRLRLSRISAFAAYNSKP